MTEIKGSMSKETEKKLDSKFKFQSKWLELADGYLISIIDNKLLNPVLMKLKTEEERDNVRNALAAVIEEMPTVEI